MLNQVEKKVMSKLNEKSLMKITQSMEKVRTSIIGVEKIMEQMDFLPSEIKDQIEHQLLLVKNTQIRLNIMLNLFGSQK